MSAADAELGPDEWIRRFSAARKDGLRRLQFFRKYNISPHTWKMLRRQLGILEQTQFPRGGSLPKGSKNREKKQSNVVSYHATPLKETIPCAPIKKRMYLLLVSLDRATLVQLLEEAEENKILHTFS